MATPTDVVSVTVALRTGVSEATLPNNVKMRSGKNYAISLEDWSKISQGAKASVIATPTFNTATSIVPLWNAANYTLDLTTINDYSTLALLNEDAQADVTGTSGTGHFFLGQVVRGFGDAAFKLVKLDSSSNTCAVGAVTTWGGVALTVKQGKAASTVTTDVSDITDQSLAPEFAGVAIGTITAGQFGWIQIAGTAYAATVASTTDAGGSVAPSTTDSTAVSVENEVQTLTLSSWDSTDTIKLTWDGHESSAVVQASDCTTTFQAAIDEVGALSTTDVTGAGSYTSTGTAYVAGDIVVTRTSATVYVFTFSGASVKQRNVGAITATSGTGSATGAVVETNAGGGGARNASTFGTALSAADTGTANILIRSSLSRPLRSRETNLFRVPRN